MIHVLPDVPDIFEYMLARLAIAMGLANLTFEMKLVFEISWSGPIQNNFENQSSL